MSTAILLFHPHYETSKVNRRLIDTLQARDPQGVTVRDEYALYPDFQIDVDAEHEFIEQHNHIVLQFPFYWYSAPALLRQWEDAVLTPGWAYAGGTALDGKTLQVVTTTGSSAAKYQTDGAYHRTMDELLSPFSLTAFRVGLAWREPFLVQGVSTITDDQLAAAGEAYADMFAQ